MWEALPPTGLWQLTDFSLKLVIGQGSYGRVRLGVHAQAWRPRASGRETRARTHTATHPPTHHPYMCAHMHAHTERQTMDTYRHIKTWVHTCMSTNSNKHTQVVF